jgi:MFS family permease
MGGSTFLIGCIPGYASIGILAPILVLLLRLVQGLALGGEYGGAATYVAEHAPANRRGYYTSWIQTTATLGLFVALGVILLVKSSMPEASFTAEWGGWRYPFWISLLLVGVSIYIRMNMSESPLFAELKSSGKTSVNPLKESFQHRANFKMVLLALFGAVMGEGVVWYTGQFYAQSFLETKCKLDFEQSRTILLWAIAGATPFFVFFGWLSDRIGRKWILMSGMLLAVLTYRLIFGYFLENSIALDPGASVITLSKEMYWRFVGLVFLLILYVTMVYGPIAAFLVELFPTRIRYTSMSLPYHIGNGVFGGLVPFIGLLLSTSFPEDPLVGLWYPIAITALCFVIGVLYLDNKADENVMD